MKFTCFLVAAELPSGFSRQEAEREPSRCLGAELENGPLFVTGFMVYIIQYYNAQ